MEALMATLTIELLHQNPWNVMSHDLPEDPSHLLLILAQMAADYIRMSEQRVMFAVRDREHVPTRQQNGTWPDAHEISESNAQDADQKLLEVSFLLGELFTEDIE
jgi:hypothetical protein